MHNIGRSIVWRILQQYSSYVIKLVVQIILARLLLPEDFGLIAVVMVFVSLGETIAVSGLGTALVQRKDADEKDFQTVLTTSLFFSGLIYLFLFFSAPVIAEFYKNFKITEILRVYGISVFLQSYLAILTANVARKFEFKRSFFATFISVVISGLVAVILAFKGAGVWALVFQSIVMSSLSIVVLHFLVPLTLKIRFYKSRFHALFSFSWKVLASSLFGTLLEDLYNLTIGKYYGNEILGFYKQGNSYPSAILGQTRMAINAVVLSAFSSIQDDKENLHSKVKKMTHFNTFLIFPMAFGLAAIADSFISVILTDKWLPCVFYLRLECIFYGILAVSSSLGQGLIAIGRSDISLYIESGKLCATILCILVMHSDGVKILCVMRIIIAVLTLLCSITISRKFLGYKFFDLIDDISKPFLLSLIMGFIVYVISFIDLVKTYIFALQIVSGIFIYIFGSFLFMRDDIKQILRLIPR